MTKRAPTAKELDDLLFAFTVCKHVKSNAIVYAKDGATVGVGAGQMNRRDSSRIAAIRAAESGEAAKLPQSPAIGSVVASDAFFPFADGLLAAAEAGATAIIQPGGSMSLAGRSLRLTISIGPVTIRPTGAKSARRSYCRA